MYYSALLHKHRVDASFIFGRMNVIPSLNIQIDTLNLLPTPLTTARFSLQSWIYS